VSVEIGLQSRLDHESNVQRYWRETHDLYLQYAGTTFQAGYLVSGGEKAEARNSNLLMAAEAGIRLGSRVLDAGCGVCGPAIDIATHLPGVTIVAITISPEQALTGKKLVREAGLSSAIEVMLANYSDVPVESQSFDVVYFLESLGYAYSLDTVCAEAFRVLKPGGRVYVKDVFQKEQPLTKGEEAGVAMFNRAYAYHTRTLSETVGSFQKAGFENVQSCDLSGRIDTSSAQRAMFGGASGPTPLGVYHLRHQGAAPGPVAIEFAQITGQRPSAAGSSAEI
jgi:ubiquinone/menaquinone biosynthesis C-methylase UbiE